jgi:hypothetical protein
VASKKPEGMVELNGYVPKDLKREFKLACTAQDKTMGEVLTELIQNWLAKQKEPPAQAKGKGGREIKDE